MLRWVTYYEKVQLPKGGSVRGGQTPGRSLNMTIL